MTKNVCISGYYGFDNFGDETILKILVENLKEYHNNINITVFSSNPEKTSSTLAVKSVKSFNIKQVISSLFKTDCLISGGGSLLQDATSAKSLIYYLFIILFAQFLHKKTIIFAQGIGPVNNTILSKLTAFAVKNASYITVRDENSLNILRNWGIKANLCNDPVWNITIDKQEKKDRIAIQLRNNSYISDSFISEFAKEVINQYKDKEILVLSLQNKLDLSICNKFKEEVIKINQNANIKVIENTSNEKIAEYIASCKELIAMRYHACLIGIKSGLKVLPINYDIKVETLANEFNLKYIDLKDNKNIGNIIKEFKEKEETINTDKIISKFFDFKSMMKEI